MCCAKPIFLFFSPLLVIWAFSAFPLLSFQLYQGCSLLKDLLQTFLLSWKLGLSFLFVCFVFSVGDGSGVIYHRAVFSLTLLNWTVYVWFSGFSFNNFIFIMKMAHFMSVFLPVWKSSQLPSQPTVPCWAPRGFWSHQLHSLRGAFELVMQPGNARQLMTSCWDQFRSRGGQKLVCMPQDPDTVSGLVPSVCSRVVFRWPSVSSPWWQL